MKSNDKNSCPALSIIVTVILGIITICVECHNTQLINETQLQIKDKEKENTLEIEQYKNNVIKIESYIAQIKKLYTKASIIKDKVSSFREIDATRVIKDNGKIKSLTEFDSTLSGWESIDSEIENYQNLLTSFCIQLSYEQEENLTSTLLAIELTKKQAEYLKLKAHSIGEVSSQEIEKYNQYLEETKTYLEADTSAFKTIYQVLSASE